MTAEKISYLEELAEDTDKRLTRMENNYQEVIDSINTQGLTISDIKSELSELQVKYLLREDLP